jgi:hypothetical protein
MKQTEIKLELLNEWNPKWWYSTAGIAGKLGITQKTVSNWRELGIKKGNKTIYLKMIKRPCHWYAKGQWIIDFLICIN